MKNLKIENKIEYISNRCRDWRNVAISMIILNIVLVLSIIFEVK